MGAGGRSASVEVGVLAGLDVGGASHLAGGIAAENAGGGGGDFVRCCCTDANGHAGCVVYASTIPSTSAATADCRPICVHSTERNREYPPGVY